MCLPVREMPGSDHEFGQGREREREREKETRVFGESRKKEEESRKRGITLIIRSAAWKESVWLQVRGRRSSATKAKRGPARSGGNTFGRREREREREREAEIRNQPP